MSEDIVKRLRERTDPDRLLLTNPPRQPPDRLCQQAADEIERLRAELAAALQDAEDLHIEVEHYAGLAFVDLGANPPIAWVDRAKEAEAERDAMRELLREARNIIPRDWAFWGRIDAALKGDQL